MTGARYLIGDVFERMGELPDGSVDLILTSPPFLALRSYLPADHPDKSKEIGSEATPAVFVDTLLRLTAEWRRLLAPYGSLCVELGDTYSGSGGAGGDYGPNGMRDGQARFGGTARLAAEAKRTGSGAGWPLAKSLALTPELYRVALAYGIHPLTGEQSPAGQWRVRNVVRWVRRNPPPGALGDKWRPATSTMVVACTASNRYWDEVATRTPYSDNTHPRVASGASPRFDLRSQQRDGNWATLGQENNPDDGPGAPLLDWWEISPGGYTGSHYAVWPPELCVRPIKAMCPERVCVECGEPSRRITETTNAVGKAVGRKSWLTEAGTDGIGAGHSGTITVAANHRTVPNNAERVTLGWSDCGHNNWRSGLVLDPFAGSGTTLAVATGLGRDAIGIDIDERNADLAVERVGGLFLAVDRPDGETRR